MGNSGSSDVTLEREDDDYVVTGDGIKLSPALLERMMSPETEQPSPTQDLDSLRQRATQAILNEREKLEESDRVLNVTRDLLKERESQMTHLVETWKEKLETEKQKHKTFYDLTLKEFEDAVDQTEKKLKKPSLRPICESLRESVIACYRDNPQQSLNCSKQVAEFTKCVANAKQNVLNRG